MKKIATPLALVCIILLSISCKNNKNTIPVIWTDQSDFASYVELFNTVQNKYNFVVQYKDNPAVALIEEKQTPDIIIGPWLKGEKARKKLVPLDFLFDKLRINPKQFYESILNLGNIKGRQYLLPVSFNLCAILFAKETIHSEEDQFLLSLERIQKLGGEYNAINEKGIYTQMGFSPRWSEEFLYLATEMFNVDFEESSRLFTWNNANLIEAINYFQAWTEKTNGSTQNEDDFAFKYLYDPPNKLVLGGKTLFSSMTSDALFTLPTDSFQGLDFRWVSRKNNTQINDKIVYMGVSKNSAHLAAAEAFIMWFYNEKTQKLLLERQKNMNIIDHSFGISGGFSALRPVNEKVFPLFYPALIGHLPPANALSVPKILPNNWEFFKKEIVMPWLVEVTSQKMTGQAAAIELENNIAAWLKSHQ